MYKYIILINGFCPIPPPFRTPMDSGVGIRIRDYYCIGIFNSLRAKRVGVHIYSYFDIASSEFYFRNHNFESDIKMSSVSTTTIFIFECNGYFYYYTGCPKCNRTVNLNKI